jgi:hypothetical protein
LFKIGIPFRHKNELIDLVNQFIETSEIKGSYFVYFDITCDTKVLKLVESNPLEINDKKVFLLPQKNVNYSKFSSDFWDMNLLGYSIKILKCDGMKECQNNPKNINKLKLIFILVIIYKFFSNFFNINYVFFILGFFFKT